MEWSGEGIVLFVSYVKLFKGVVEWSKHEKVF